MTRIFAAAFLLLGLSGTMLTVSGMVTVGTLSLEREALPGETYETTIVANNDGDKMARVFAYQTDYLFYSDGSNLYGEAGSTERSNAKWITVSPKFLDVPPGQSSVFHCSVRVPDDANLAGSYWSMLMVEEQTVPGEVPDSLEPDDSVVRQVLRYGVQCITNIRDTGVPQASFTDSRLVLVDGEKHELQIAVENTGNRWFVPTPYVELFDSNGRQVGRFESTEKRIFPGTSVRFQIGLGKVPSGKYKALVVLDNGDQHLFGARYDLDF